MADRGVTEREGLRVHRALAAGIDGRGGSTASCGRREISS